MDMSLEVLKKFAEDSGDSEILTAIESVRNSFNENVTRLGALEKDLAKAISKRDGIKTVVRDKLGIDDVNEDALDAFLGSIKENADISTIAENKKLSDTLGAMKQDRDSLELKHRQQLDSYKLERALSEIGGREDSNGTQAYSILLSELSKGFSFDDSGVITFKANDGTTLRNSDGTPMSISDKYNSFKDSDEFSFLFKPRKYKSGSGKDSGQQKGGSDMGLKRSTMSHADKGKYIQDHGQDMYLKLPN